MKLPDVGDINKYLCELAKEHNKLICKQCHWERVTSYRDPMGHHTARVGEVMACGDRRKMWESIG